MKGDFEASIPSLNRMLLNRDVRGTITEFAWKFCVGPYMPLSIEWMGDGPRGNRMISMMHTFTQNGDMMRDPDVEIECVWHQHSCTWKFLPVSYRQDGLGIFREHVSASEDGRGYLVNRKGVQDLCSFCHTWSINLNQQGFVEASLLPNWLTSTPQKEND